MTEELPFTVATDAKTGVTTATLTGSWNIATAKAYGERLATAAEKNAAAVPRQCWLIDLSRFDVQAREIAEYMTDVIADLTARYDPAVAVISPRALVGLQSRRIAQRPDHRSFVSGEEARAWLEQQ